MERDELLYIYDQASLYIEDSEVDKAIIEIDTVMNSLNILDQLDLDGVDMLENVLDKKADLREDEAFESIRRSKALENTDMLEYGYFKIDDRVVE